MCMPHSSQALSRRAPRPTTAHRTLSRWRYLSSAAPSLSTARTPAVIFSGIQPTGVPHLGNYLGALRQWVQLQNDDRPVGRGANNDDGRPPTHLYSLVDLHALTTQPPAEQLRQWRRESLAALVAVGLDPARSIIFHQSQIPQHAELMWILSCHSSMGLLSRMTQWKTKMQASTPASASPHRNLDEAAATSLPHLRLGLFSYPVLQAADILLYSTTHVPVGADQAQHIEFARDLAHSFNHRLSHNKDNKDDEILTPPHTLLSPSPRIMSLTTPHLAKMSKSDPNPRSRILLSDDKPTIASKLKAALTDSVTGPITYEPAARPGVANLISILYHTNSSVGQSGGSREPATMQDLTADVAGLSMRALKERVADAVDGTLAPIRERYREVLRDAGELDDIAERGRVRASALAAETMGRVRTAVGLS